MFIDENSKPKEKLKAWYLFTEDFIAGTQHMTNEEIGIYIRLLCWNWNKRCKGIPNNENLIFRIAVAFDQREQQICLNVLNENFKLINQSHWQNERQLQEYLYITKRIDASKLNGKLGGRPKKPNTNPPTSTPTSTSSKSSSKYNPLFNKFWDKINNKISKGIAEKNFLKVEEEWKNEPEKLAELYNSYYSSIDDKQFAKQPAFWLSAKKYLDENPKKENNEKIDQLAMRTKVFKEAIEKKEASAWVKKYARQNSYDVKEAVEKNYFSKEDAIKYLDMGSWI